MNVQLDNGPYDIGSFFRRVSYRVKMSIGVRSNALLTVASLLHMGTGRNLINTDFLPQAWKDTIKWIQLQPLRTANREVMNIEGFVYLFIRTGDLRIRVWLGTFDNYDVAVLLGTSFMYRYIGGQFSIERQVLPSHLRPVAIYSPKMAISSTYADIKVFNENIKPLCDDVSKEGHLCRIARRVRIPAYTQAALLIKGQGVGLIPLSTYGNVPER